MGEVARMQPARQDFALYDDGNPWFFDIRVAALGDLTGATIVAKFVPKSGSTPSALTISTTPEGLLDSTFSMGHTTPVRGQYDISISLPAGPARTYIYGEVTARIDRAP